MRLLLVICLNMMVTVHGKAQMQQGFVNLSDGKLYYQKTGTGTPLLFLHGICLDHRMWEDQVNYFSDSFTCINMDLRGFGKSSVPGSAPYSFHEDIHTLLDSLHIEEPVVIIALSMGGKAAVNFSLAYPHKTKALVLADVAIDGYSFEEFILKPIYDAGMQKGIDTANQLFLDHPIFLPAKKDTAVFRRLSEMILSYSGWQWVHKNPMQGLTPPAIEQLQKIKVPVLIITGEKDIRDFQQIAEILHKNIKQSVKMQITGAGHMSNMENPELFNRLVSDFLISVK
ncbi:MAG TPA: alpha/beta hydrolase [Puia sp.]|nr:alpha/beta hydrolase [Puia sp.]